MELRFYLGSVCFVTVYGDLAFELAVVAQWRSMS
jgi:hypothetical protein